MKPTDAELLEQYRSSASAEAFAQLARRHVDWVYCVARRRVRDAHLAEDVTQGAFTVLAQKPPRLKAGQSLSAWLFRVVNFVSLRATRTEQRRRARETEAAKMKNLSESSPTEIWGSLESQLDDLIGRLGSRDRQAVLLRFYEQQSFAEIAAALGMTEFAARKRVSRATEKLRTMLAGKGIAVPSMALSGALLAQVTQPATASITAAVATAPAAASSASAALAKSAITMMTWAKFKTAAAIAALIAFATSGLLIVATTAQQQSPPQQAGPTSAPATPPIVAAAQPASPAPVNNEIMRVKGIVLDPTGKPVAGAKITVPPPANWNDRLNIKPVAEATSGADGRYEIAFRKSDVAPFSIGGGGSGEDAWRTAKIVASAEGFGMAWSMWDHVDAAGDVQLKLVPDDLPVEGRILTSTGQPAPGVRVVVTMAEPIMTMAERIAAVSKDPSFAQSYSLWLPLHASGRFEPIFTDADGKFRLSGIGKDRRVTLYVFGPLVGYKRFSVATRLMEPQAQLAPQGTGVVEKFMTYGAKFEYTAEPGQGVEGMVVDAASGQPMAGVEVQSMRFAGPFQGMDPQGLIACVTDAQGRYRLDGFPKGEGNQLVAVPNDEQSYFMRVIPIPDAPGIAPAILNVELHKGVWITGRVTDQTTGQPVAARISYTTYLNNLATRDFPEFEKDGADSGYVDSIGSRYETKPDGTYQIVAVPGPAIVWIWEQSGRFPPGQGEDQIKAIANKGMDSVLFQPLPAPGIGTAARQVEVPAGAQSVTADFQLTHGLTVQVSIVDPDGSPVTRGVMVRGEVSEKYGGWFGRTIDGGGFDAVAFTPGEQRTMIVMDLPRKLGRIMVAKIDELPDKKLTIPLQPMVEVSGRCLDTDGKPLEAIPIDARVNNRSVSGYLTEADGRFKFPLAPGGEYTIRVDRGPYSGFRIKENFSPAPGSTLDLGDIQITAPRR